MLLSQRILESASCSPLPTAMARFQGGDGFMGSGSVNPDRDLTTMGVGGWGGVVFPGMGLGVCSVAQGKGAPPGMDHRDPD